MSKQVPLMSGQVHTTSACGSYHTTNTRLGLTEHSPIISLIPQFPPLHPTNLLQDSQPMASYTSELTVHALTPAPSPALMIGKRRRCTAEETHLVQATAPPAKKQRKYTRKAHVTKKRKGKGKDEEISDDVRFPDGGSPSCERCGRQHGRIKSWCDPVNASGSFPS
ncbi:hypothetical protein BKA93DRAFT_808230 [Sparassis latifolia]